MKFFQLPILETGFILIFILSFMGFSLTGLYGQNDSLKAWVYIDGEFQHKQVEKKAQYKQGNKEFLKKIYEDIQYPPEAREDGIGGKVVYEYEISKEGKVENIVLIKSVRPDIDKEVKRVFLNSTKGNCYEPAIYKGKPVRTKREFPIQFQLQ